MTPEQFCYWLQGRLELNDSPLSAEETKMVKEHLATVFHKITPLKMPSGLAPMPTQGDDGFNPISYTITC